MRNRSETRAKIMAEAETKAEAEIWELIGALQKETRAIYKKCTREDSNFRPSA